MSLPTTRLLLIEDNPGDVHLLRAMLAEAGSQKIELLHADCVGQALTQLVDGTINIVMLDLGLPDAQGLDSVRRIRLAAPGTPLIVLTGLDDESMAVRALHEGAQDYLVKGQIEPRGLLRALRYAAERKATQDALMAQKELAEGRLNCIGDGVACTDGRGHITFLNVAAERMTGWLLPEALDRPVEEIFNIVDTSTRLTIPDADRALAGGNRRLRLPPNCSLIRRDGSEMPVEDSIAATYDGAGGETGAVIVFRDVSGARALSRQVVHVAQHDFLTGLPNRTLLNEHIGCAIGQAHYQQKKVAVLFLDLDGFKHINDSLGHAVGDKLLQSVALRLKSCVGEADTVSRQGGDEFVVLLPQVEEAADAIPTARKLLEAVAGTHYIEDSELHVTTSIGVSIYPDDGLDAETLLKNADTAMYRAKDNGRQSFQFFEPAMRVRAVERQSIEESLRKALQREEFVLHYQPQIDLGTGAICGAEALIRWNHPTRGLLAPQQFIPIAEDCGLILPISRWVLREACTQAGEWTRQGLAPIAMAVNISAIDFRDENFLAHVFAILEETGVDPSLLELELTENVLMKRADAAEQTLRELKAQGIRLAVDDFGTGYSSLSYLRTFSIDALKIDQSFIRLISASPDQTAIVTAMIGMGRDLKLRVIAEGVETQQELDFLRAHHCDEAQGYHFGRPMPPAQLGELLGRQPFLV